MAKVKVEANTKFSDLPELLTVGQAAAYSGYSEKYLRNSFSRGHFPIAAKRLGRSWRVPKEQLNAKIERTFK